MPHENTGIKERNHTGLKEPGKYNVIFHNDDFTPMEFVTYVLIQIFHKNPVEAEALMLKVHHSGKAIAGTYSYDIAMTKISMVTQLARNNNYPLRLTIQPN